MPAARVKITGFFVSAGRAAPDARVCPIDPAPGQQRTTIRACTRIDNRCVLARDDAFLSLER